MDKREKFIFLSELEIFKLCTFIFFRVVYLFLIMTIAGYCVLAKAMPHEASQEKKELKFLLLSDIHFDPFIGCALQKPCVLIEKLRQTSSKNWRGLLMKTTHSVKYFSDTDFFLWDAMLQELKAVTSEKYIPYVVITGDFLGHRFRRKYKKYSSDKSMRNYSFFVRKTMQFMLSEISQVLPRSDIYIVLGNNDSYVDNYAVSYPNSLFFRDLADMGSRLIQHSNNRLSMQRQFKDLGYYSVVLQDTATQAIRLIVLNTNFFSFKARGRNVANFANRELMWLRDELRIATKEHQVVYIAMHIPDGLDVYFHGIYMFRLVQFWKKEYSDQFKSEICSHASVKSFFVGHTHLNRFYVENLGVGCNIPVVNIPAISPLYGNYPAFKVLAYDANFKIKENLTYYLNIKNKWFMLNEASLLKY